MIRDHAGEGSPGNGKRRVPPGNRNPQAETPTDGRAGRYVWRIRRWEWLFAVQTIPGTNPDRLRRQFGMQYLRLWVDNSPRGQYLDQMCRTIVRAGGMALLGSAIVLLRAAARCERNCGCLLDHRGLPASPSTIADGSGLSVSECRRALVALCRPQIAFVERVTWDAARTAIAAWYAPDAPDGDARPGGEHGGRGPMATTPGDGSSDPGRTGPTPGGEPDRGAEPRTNHGPPATGPPTTRPAGGGRTGSDGGPDRGPRETPRCQGPGLPGDQEQEEEKSQAPAAGRRWAAPTEEKKRPEGPAAAACERPRAREEGHAAAGPAAQASGQTAGGDPEAAGAAASASDADGHDCPPSPTAPGEAGEPPQPTAPPDPPVIGDRKGAAEAGRQAAGEGPGGADGRRDGAAGRQDGAVEYVADPEVWRGVHADSELPTCWRAIREDRDGIEWAKAMFRACGYSMRGRNGPRVWARTRPPLARLWQLAARAGLDADELLGLTEMAIGKARSLGDQYREHLAGRRGKVNPGAVLTIWWRKRLATAVAEMAKGAKRENG